MKKIAIFASGSGTNFKSIVDYTRKNDINGEVLLLVCNKNDAYVLKRADEEGIETFTFNPKDYPDKKSYEKDIIKKLKDKKIDFICLAGYMLIIGRELLNEYKERIINIHPSLLPAFKGKNAVKDALEYGVKVTGVTIHFVDEGIDTGKIIDQEPVIIDENDTIIDLKQKIQKVEHKLYPKVLKYLL